MTNKIFENQQEILCIFILWYLINKVTERWPATYYVCHYLLGISKVESWFISLVWVDKENSHHGSNAFSLKNYHAVSYGVKVLMILKFFFYSIWHTYCRFTFYFGKLLQLMNLCGSSNFITNVQIHMIIS